MTQAPVEQFKQDTSQEDQATSQEEPELQGGTVFADKGEPSPADLRKLWWELNPQQRNFADVVMGHQLDVVRDMDPKERQDRVQDISESLGRVAAEKAKEQEAENTVGDENSD